MTPSEQAVDDERERQRRREWDANYQRALDNAETERTHLKGKLAPFRCYRPIACDIFSLS